MLNRKSSTNSAGFTIVELTIVIILIGLISTVAYTIFNNTFNQYFSLQKDATNLTDLTAQSHRISNVLRGTTDIASATQDELVAYAYFSPNDQFVSKVRYYKNAQNTKLFADVTDMTENQPTGVPIVSSLKTYTILESFYQSQGTSLFEYLDSSGNTLALPISDLSTIKGIRVNLAAQTSNQNKGQSMSVQVSLRNRKTNL